MTYGPSVRAQRPISMPNAGTAESVGAGGAVCASALLPNTPTMPTNAIRPFLIATLFIEVLYCDFVDFIIATARGLAGCSGHTQLAECCSPPRKSFQRFR